MPSLTVENYVKTIYQICTNSGGSPASTGKISESLGVSPEYRHQHAQNTQRQPTGHLHAV